MPIPKQAKFKPGFMELCVKSDYRQFYRIVDDMNKGIAIDRASMEEAWCALARSKREKCLQAN